MKKLYILFLIGLFFLISPNLSFAATPGEVYEKHRKEILKGGVSLIKGNVFLVVFSEKEKTKKNNLLFRKMKLRALKELGPRFLLYKYPSTNKDWFELYYNLPSNSKKIFKKSFVVDKNKASDPAYLVLTIPEKEIASSSISPNKIKDTVNRAFDNGTLANLSKYSRVVSGERLKEVKKKIAQRAAVRVSKKKNKDIFDQENKKGKLGDQSQNPVSLAEEDKTNDIQATQLNEELVEEQNQQKIAEEKPISEDQINIPIDCELPLCEEINKRSNKRNSLQEKTNKANPNKNSLGETTINKKDELVFTMCDSHALMPLVKYNINIG